MDLFSVAAAMMRSQYGYSAEQAERAVNHVIHEDFFDITEPDEVMAIEDAECILADFCRAQEPTSPYK